MRKASIILTLCFFLNLGFNAESQILKLYVKTAGTLSTLLGSKESHIKDLTLSGYLNGSDIYTIRNMDSLTILNLANSSIVSGGNAYYNDGTYDFNTSENKLGTFMFRDCSNLTSLVLPDNLVSIGHDALMHCSGLTSITLPNKLTTLEPFALAGLFNLNSITIPNSVTSIGFPLIYWGTDAITQINVDNQNPNYCSVDGVLFNKDTTSVLTYPTARNSGYTIPNSVKSIGNNAFAMCSGLTSITIPSSVTSIGEGAFIFCTSLTSIKLPESLITIGDYAFDCYNLTELHCEMKTPPAISRYVFTLEDMSKIKLYVPSGSSSAYHMADNWCNFSRIIESGPTAIAASKSSQIKVFSKEDVLIVDGVESGDEVSVYTLTGALLRHKKATNTRVEFNQLRNDLYIVKTPQKTIKAAHFVN